MKTPARWIKPVDIQSRAVIQAVVPVTCLGAATSASAVDGVGLGEMFPILPWILAAILVAAALLVLRAGFSDRAKQENRTFRKSASVLMAAVILWPLEFSLLQSAYVGYLCRTEATASISIPVEEWHPVRPDEGRLARRGTNQLAPGLLRYFEQADRALGVRDLRLRLADEHSGKTLMEARGFTTDKYGGPFACSRTSRYEIMFHKYIERAEAATRAQ